MPTRPSKRIESANPSLPKVGGAADFCELDLSKQASVYRELLRRCEVGLRKPVIAARIGEGRYFRQAVVSPLQDDIGEDGDLLFYPEHRPTLLIERLNGQLLCIQLSIATLLSIRLDDLVEQIENALKIGQTEGVHAHEFIVQLDGAKNGCFAMVETSLDPQAPSVLSKTIPELALSLCRDGTTLQTNESAAENLAVLNEAEAYVRSQLCSSVEHFVAGLDVRIISALVQSTTDLIASNYNAFRRLGKTALNRRLQAAEVFPLITGHLIEKGKPFAKVRSAIDHGKPMIPELAKALGVPVETARWLVGKDIALVGTRWASRLINLAQALECLCPEHRPQALQDWAAFNDFAWAIEQLAPVVNDKQAGTNSFKTLIQSLGKIGWHVSKTKLESMGATVSDLTDMDDMIDEIVAVLAEDLGEGGVLTEVLHESLPPHVKEAFFSIGIFRQLEASLYWHRLLNQPVALADASAECLPGPTQSWPAAFDGTVCVNKLYAVCLTNRAQLNDEGLHMQHCIRTYADQCLYYGATIISFRDNRGVRVSTAHLQLDESRSGKLVFKVSQHRGYRNAMPNEDTNIALMVLLLRLNSKSNALHREQIQRDHVARNQSKQTRPSEPTDPARIRHLKKALKRHIGYDGMRQVVSQSLHFSSSGENLREDAPQ